MQSPTIEQAIEAQNRVGQTAAQFQSNTSAEVVRRANASAKAAMAAARDRKLDEHGMEAVDLSDIPRDHVEELSHVLSSPIRRAMARAGTLMPLAATHMLSLEKALKEEIAAEFWRLGGQVRSEYEELRADMRRDQPVAAGGTVASGGTVEAGGTIGSGSTLDSDVGVTSSSGKTIDSAGTVGSAGSVDAAGTVVNAGTVTNEGTAG